MEVVSIQKPTGLR